MDNYFEAEQFIKLYKDHQKIIENMNSFNDNYGNVKKDNSGLKNQDEKKEKKRQYAKKSREKKRRHEKFVEKCLYPKGFLHGDNEVFALVHAPEYEDTKQDSEYVEYRISLVTPLMAYTDYCYFNRKYDGNNAPWWYNEYRPYYYYMTLMVPKDNKDRIELLKKKSEEGWFITNIEISEKCKDNESYYCGRLMFGGSKTFSYDVSIKLCIDDFDGLERINRDEKRKREEKRKLLKELYGIYKGKIKSIAPVCYKNVLNRAIKRTDKYTIDILNVGQANCIHVRGKGFSFLYDVGVPYESTGNKNKENDVKNEDYTDSSNVLDNICCIRQYKPSFIIISHWDLDHVCGLIHMCDEGIGTYWIAPEITDILNDVACMRLAIYAAENNKLCLVNRCGAMIYENEDASITLYRGKYKNANSSCLIVQIGNTILPGDSMYRFWPGLLKARLGDIDKFVVPHHGGAICDGDSDVIENISAREAYISVGANSYGHPFDEHIRLLHDNGIKLAATGGKDVSGKFGTYISEIVDFKYKKITIEEKLED